MDCLDESALAELFESGARARAGLEDHLDGCSKCRALVAAYARAAGESATVRRDDTPFAATVSSIPPPASGEEAHKGQLVAERYLLERVVGEGGMGVVWAARDLAENRHVALKLLKSFSPELARRSWREARAAAQVSHPALVPVLDVLTPPGARAPILVMPLLRGESLDVVLARRGTLPVSEALALLSPVISGVRAAHERGVIHRDLKPQNVFVASPDVYVLDFGLAKLLGGTDEAADKLTRTGALLGTPHYMAPEQLFGDARVDHRADVWALGVILYECISGQRPIEGRSYGQIVKNAARGAIKTFAEAAPNASAEVAALVTGMLTPERDARPELAEVEARARAITS